ncbi:MAG: NADH-quinone oxidoreductase subunit C [Deltaproteobacteria bacterium]|nr:NADH-quinone oxidoreductase subunit C [Deltaproteobacteria bacterium]
MTEALLALPNGAAVSQNAVPELTLDALREAIETASARGRRVSALFGAPRGERLALYVVLADDAAGLLECGSATLDGDEFPSMTPSCPEVQLFEREVAEQWGVVPRGHPWFKPVRFHRSYRAPRDAWGRAPEDPLTVGVMDFFRVDGEEVHEVAVGPVHAGVIEPGHFRFQCHGEHVMHLEVSLGYQHRGVERSLLGGPGKRTIHYMETLAGDTTVGHATAYCQLREALGASGASARACALRGVALELERLANHTGDLGALAGDVGFLPTASYCGRLRGDFLNMTAVLCGSRFGRGLLRPGGVAFDLEPERAAELRKRLDRAARDVTEAVKLLWDAPSVMARLEDTGRLDAATAAALGLVGPASRACGLRRDVRKTHPAGIYRLVHLPISTADSGDVFARAYVRWLEIERSIEYLRAQLGELPRGPTARECPAPRGGHLAVALVEGWRGELCHVALTDEAGRFSTYKVVDPSFHNWPGLALAMRGQQLSDFPLCNKSFNLSYCGQDL